MTIITLHVCVSMGAKVKWVCFCVRVTGTLGSIGEYLEFDVVMTFCSIDFTYRKACRKVMHYQVRGFECHPKCHNAFSRSTRFL